MRADTHVHTKSCTHPLNIAQPALSNTKAAVDLQTTHNVLLLSPALTLVLIPPPLHTLTNEHMYLLLHANPFCAGLGTVYHSG